MAHRWLVIEDHLQFLPLLAAWALHLVVIPAHKQVVPILFGCHVPGATILEFHPGRVCLVTHYGHRRKGIGVVPHHLSEPLDVGGNMPRYPHL